MAEFREILRVERVDESGNVLQAEDIDLRRGIVGEAAPTENTPGMAGLPYYVVRDGKITAEYVCVAAEEGVYTWKKKESGTVDDTLTVPGAAADAKAVGDKVTELSGAIANIPSGKDGVGIQSVVQTTTSTEDGGTNVVTVTTSDGTSYTFQVKNGSKGSTGKAGADGHTPVKGTDYFTAADKREIAEEAAGMVSIPDKLPNPNAITFTGAVTGSYDGSAPLSVEIPSGGGGSSGGSGKAKSQILIDQEITELTASLSVTLEHDFHNLTAIINSGSSGVALTADADGNAVVSKIGLFIDTTSYGYNAQKVSTIDTTKETWQNQMMGAEWSDDLSKFKRGFGVKISTDQTQQYTFGFGGYGAMYGIFGTDDNAPKNGRTANIVAKGAYLNVGTRVVLWGEYYE